MTFDKSLALAEIRKLQILALHSIRHADSDTLTRIYGILDETVTACRKAIKAAKMPEKWCWHCDNCGFEREAAGRKNCFNCGSTMRVKEIV